nr:MAG TPA: hypothetical protein [Caudoviricetes sp.]
MLIFQYFNTKNFYSGIFTKTIAITAALVYNKV